MLPIAVKPRHPMQPFHDLLQHILDNGVKQQNRTGVACWFVPSACLTFDLQNDGFCAITTKRLAFKSAVGELLGFFRGYQSAADFRAIGCKVWDGNANETPSWLANPNRKGTDDLGRCYSAQWTDWRDWREANSPEEADALQQKGYELRAHDVQRGVWVFRRGINQLELCLQQLLTDPTNRRVVISAWRPDEFDQMALPPCHCTWSFTADVASNTLHLSMWQRSWDAFLAFNHPMAGVFLSIMAKMTGMQVGTLTHFSTTPHIYENHVDQVRELLSREHYPQPTLKLGDSIERITSLDQIPGAFARIRPEDITLEGYVSHPAIRAPMAV